MGTTKSATPVHEKSEGPILDSDSRWRVYGEAKNERKHTVERSRRMAHTCSPFPSPSGTIVLQPNLHAFAILFIASTIATTLQLGLAHVGLPFLQAPPETNTENQVVTPVIKRDP